MSISGASVLSGTAKIVGNSNVATDPARIAAFEIDGSSPAAVVQPGSSDEVVELARFATHEKLAIVATGAQTKLGIGMPPRQYDLALEMTRLDRVIAYDPGDLTLSVEPGITLHKIASVLSEHRQFLPLAAAFGDRATAGGTVASGVDSPMRHMYGTARDFVLGMEFVTGDGVAVKSGGRVVKNVTGYDIHKLMIGSLGTLGIITRINFRTFPQPQTARTCIATFRGSTGACELRRMIAHSSLRPQSLEILAASADCAPELSRRAGLSFENSRWSVVATFAGDARVLDRNRHDLEAFAQAADPKSLESFAELRDAAAENVARYIAGFPGVILQYRPAAAIFKISALPTDLAGLAAGILSSEIGWTAVMRGLGVTYLALLAPDDSERSLQLLKPVCARIFSLAEKAPWGPSVMLWCPSKLKSEINIWGAPRGDFSLMKKLKGVFDPGGVLSPGRYVGGL
ncbi:MAG TPA: FAD-binding oxidoreductase [Candidatus Acidoferrales bacterium]